MLDGPPPGDDIAQLSREFAYTCDSDGTITWADARAERLLGMRPGDVLLALAVPGEAEKIARFLRAALNGPTEAWELAQVARGVPCTLAVWAKPYVDGVLVVGNVLADSYGPLQAAAAGIASELATLQREAERKWRELDAARLLQQKLFAREREAHASGEAARAHVTQILESISDAFVAIDDQGRFTYANGRARELFGRGQTDLTGQWVVDALPSRLGTAVLEASQKVREQRQTVQRDVQLGDDGWVELRAYAAEESVSIFFTDISARKERGERVRYTALHDPLTGLLNRRAFDDTLGRLADRARHGQRGALLLLDLDHFTRINDAGGHLAGDEVLRRVAELLRGQVQPDDILARLGGDEFALLLAETPIEVATMLAELLVHAVAGVRLDWAGQVLHLGISIGVTPIDARPTSAIVACADTALHRAKEMGGNRVEVSRDPSLASDRTGAVTSATHERNPASEAPRDAMDLLLARLIQKVAVAREIAKRGAAAARMAGNRAEAERFDVAAREAEQRLSRLLGIRITDSGWKAPGSGWLL